MQQEELIHKVMAEVMASLAKNDSTVTTSRQPSTARPQAATTSGGRVSSEQYPLGEKIPEQIHTSTGKAFAGLSYEDVVSGQVRPEDMRISAETLEMQAAVADSVGREALARNFRRAAELIAVPDDELLVVYDALRPYRSTKDELLALADRLRQEYGCEINAEFIREAASVYESRNRLRVD